MLQILETRAEKNWDVVEILKVKKQTKVQTRIKSTKGAKEKVDNAGKWTKRGQERT